MTEVSNVYQCVQRYPLTRTDQIKPWRQERKENLQIKNIISSSFFSKSPTSTPRSSCSNNQALSYQSLVVIRIYVNFLLWFCFDHPRLFVINSFEKKDIKFSLTLFKIYQIYFFSSTKISQCFIIKLFKHRAKCKGFYSEHPHIT